MGRVNHTLVLSTISYTIFTLGCVVLSMELFDSKFEAIVVTLFLSMAFGYIISSHLLFYKQRQDTNLQHLTKEILHELNIPLSTIELNANMLKKRLQDEKMLKRVDRIEASSLRLKRLYKELSYAIKKEIEAIPKEEFGLYELVYARVEEFLEQQRQDFELDIPQEITITADKIGFEKMIDNLISNAMKYSPKNSTIKIYYKDNKLHIQDSGIGMDEVELLKVFERYYQSSSANQGDGIGLAIVKEYCDNNGISIEIVSTKNVGTTIKLYL